MLPALPDEEPPDRLRLASASLARRCVPLARWVPLPDPVEVAVLPVPVVLPLEDCACASAMDEESREARVTCKNVDVFMGFSKAKSRDVDGCPPWINTLEAPHCKGDAWGSPMPFASTWTRTKRLSPMSEPEKVASAIPGRDRPMSADMPSSMATERVPGSLAANCPAWQHGIMLPNRHQALHCAEPPLERPPACSHKDPGRPPARSPSARSPQQTALA